jgi:ubiquinone/menaquinone biosynthesis C-methylase UbiE
VGDGSNLPLRDESIDLVTCAQMIHHVPEPIPLLAEMRRVAGASVLVVDQVSTEDPAEIEAMNELELLRDPSHARSRPPSEYRTLMKAAGLTIEDERIVETEDRFSKWMWAEEFPQERVHAVRKFVELRGPETGMEFHPEGDDYVYTRRRIMILAWSENRGSDPA